MKARHVLPGFTERTGSGTRTLDPYTKLLESRIVLLGTRVDEVSSNDVITQLLYLEYAAPEQDIALYINSPGGSVTAMTAIHDTIRTLACDVATTCLGRAASSAAVLLAAGTPGKRTMLPGARVTLRQPAAEEPLHGRPSDLDVHARELLRQRALMAGLLAGHTGRSSERVEADLDRLAVLDAPAAVEYGLVDHVITSRRAAAGRAAR
ncbi:MULTISPECIES: ATP-dependent Clp protease proteolytic subunit [unclassified Streptomyces]|uniref:ATP-dependent Clp protease proteolytic subunit n=1 Tax=unclassified Streptomyces TaxID=2593676 RepID=UPI00381635A8